MIETLLTIAVIVPLLYASQMWWKSHLNPVTIGILAWTPGLIMLHWQPYFLSPIYIHLNRPVAPELYIALALGFVFFWAGCAVTKALSRPSAFQIQPARLALDINVTRAMIFFGIGLLVFAYVYFNSGLLDLQDLDEVGVAESRLRLHIGPVSFLILFMDVAAIGLFVRFLQQRGGLIYALPLLIAMLCQAATLQKSRFMFLVFAAVLLCALHPRETYHIFFRDAARRLLVGGFGVSVIAALFAMNAARGVATTQMTAASSSVLEQVYIYSGAAAMQNVSVTLEGYMPSDEPAMGAYLARPVLWHFVDRDLFFVSRYFEGINAATYLIYGWGDFRWYGFVITPFILGILVMLFLRFTLSGTMIGFVLGVIEMQVLVYSPNTDVMFDPTTLVLIAIGLIAQFFTYPFERRRSGRPTYTVRPGGLPPPASRMPGPARGPGARTPHVS